MSANFVVPNVKLNRIGYSCLTGVPLTPERLQRHQKLAQLRGQVADASNRIEHLMENAIARFLFPVDDTKRAFFFLEIVRSDIIPMDKLRRIVLRIVQQENLLKGQKLDQFTQVVSSVNKHRNRYVHGDFLEKEDGTYLVFYEGGRQEVLVDEARIKKLEADFARFDEIWRTIDDGIQALPGSI